MFWGIFLVVLGTLMLSDRWDIYCGGFVSKLVIAGLLAWGGSILADYGRRGRGDEKAVGEGRVDSTTTTAD